MEHPDSILAAFAATLYLELEASLQENVNADSVIKAEQSLTHAKHALGELKKFVLRYHFETAAEEIEFFKTIKPRFSSLLIFYHKVFQIETEKPEMSRKALHKFLDKEIRRLRYYFENHTAFYRYFRSGATYLDEQYFMRGHQEVHLPVNPFYYDSDERFSTTMDYQAARVLANDRLHTYLKNLQGELGSDRDLHGLPLTGNHLKWTASKTALIELLYALQSNGVFNDGSADIKQVATYFEKMFAVDLGNYYRTFQEIRIRKSGRTNFLDQLTEKLVRRMDETDDNPKYAA
jgi:hypothetical protein